MATHSIRPGQQRDRHRPARQAKPTAPDRRPSAGTAGKRGDREEATRGSWQPHWAAAVLAIALAAGATFALFEFVLIARLPAAVVGEWRVVGGEMDGATFEFHRDGTMVGRLTVRGKEG